MEPTPKRQRLSLGERSRNGERYMEPYQDSRIARSTYDQKKRSRHSYPAVKIERNDHFFEPNSNTEYDEEEDEEEDLADWYAQPLGVNPEGNSSQPRETSFRRTSSSSRMSRVVDPRSQYPSTFEILAQFGSELGPKIARYVDRACRKQAMRQTERINETTRRIPISTPAPSSRSRIDRRMRQRGSQSPDDRIAPIMMPPPRLPLNRQNQEDFELRYTPMHSRHSRHYNRANFTPAPIVSSKRQAREPQVQRQSKVPLRSISDSNTPPAMRNRCSDGDLTENMERLLVKYPLSEYHDSGSEDEIVSQKQEPPTKEEKFPHVQIRAETPQSRSLEYPLSDDDRYSEYIPNDDDERSWNSSQTESDFDDHVPTLPEEVAAITQGSQPQPVQVQTIQEGKSFGSRINLAYNLNNFTPSKRTDLQDRQMEAQTHVPMQTISGNAITQVSGDPNPPKRKRGRPRKHPIVVKENQQVSNDRTSTSFTENDRSTLWQWIKMLDKKGIPVWTRDHWKELQKRHPQHTSSQWRTHFKSKFPSNLTQRLEKPPKDDPRLSQTYPSASLITNEELIEVDKAVPAVARGQINLRGKSQERPVEQRGTPTSRSVSMESNPFVVPSDLSLSEPEDIEPGSCLEEISSLLMGRGNQNQVNSEARPGSSSAANLSPGGSSNASASANKKQKGSVTGTSVSTVQCFIGQCNTAIGEGPEYRVLPLPGEIVSEFMRHVGVEHSKTPFPCREDDCDRIGPKGFSGAMELAIHTKRDHPAAAYERLKGRIDEEIWSMVLSDSFNESLVQVNDEVREQEGLQSSTPLHSDSVDSTKKDHINERPHYTAASTFVPYGHFHHPQRASPPRYEHSLRRTTDSSSTRPLALSRSTFDRPHQASPSFHKTYAPLSAPNASLPASTVTQIKQNAEPQHGNRVDIEIVDDGDSTIGDNEEYMEPADDSVPIEDTPSGSELRTEAPDPNIDPRLFCEDLQVETRIDPTNDETARSSFEQEAESLAINNVSGSIDPTLEVTQSDSLAQEAAFPGDDCSAGTVGARQGSQECNATLDVKDQLAQSSLPCDPLLSEASAGANVQSNPATVTSNESHMEELSESLEDHQASSLSPTAVVIDNVQDGSMQGSLPSKSKQYSAYDFSDEEDEPVRTSSNLAQPSLAAIPQNTTQQPSVGTSSYPPPSPGRSYPGPYSGPPTAFFTVR